MADLFSTAALLIMFREALEASVIISIMLQMLARLQMTALRKYVWWGALSGVGLAIGLGIIFICLFWVAKNSVFSGEGKIIFEGFLFLIAGWLISVLGFAMLKFKNYERNWEAKMLATSQLNDKSGRSGVFILAFTTTLREGLEAVIFLAGTTAGSSPESIPIPGVIGLIIGIIVGVLLYYTGKQIHNIAWFMVIMTCLLFLLGAGLTAHAIVQFQSVNWFGYAQLPLSARPWQTQQIWDWSACCSSDINKNFFFGLIGTLFGYTEYGTAMWLFAWFGYWIEIFTVLMVRLWRGELTDAKKKYNRRNAQDAENPNMVPLKEERGSCDSDQDPKLQQQIGQNGLNGSQPGNVPDNSEALLVHKNAGEVEMSRPQV